MSEGGETNSLANTPESLKTRVGRRLLRMAIGGNQENGLDFKSIRVVRGHLKDIDDQIPLKGLPNAIKEHFQKLGYNIEPQYQEDRTREVLEKSPALVVANHPFLMDPVNLIASLPEARRDVSVIGNTAFQTLGDNFAQHVIPVYRSGNDYQVEGRALLWRKYGIPQEEHALFEAGRLNRQSINTAAQKINEGGLVILFPDGSTEGKEWYSGVGELVKQIDRDDAQIVFAATEKPRYRDYMRVSSKVASIMNPTTTNVTYSAPHGVEEFDVGGTRQLITQNLKASYDSFAKLAV